MSKLSKCCSEVAKTNGRIVNVDMAMFEELGRDARVKVQLRIFRSS